MKATDITVTAQVAIEKVLASFDLYKQNFRTLDEHLAFCGVISNLFGEEVYDKVICPACIREASKKYPQEQD